MNSLAKLRIISRFPRIYRPYATYEKKEDSPWLRDNAPGPYPKTEEEKCAAAKKYGLLREEYEPYPDDGDGYGDYPKLEPVNVEFRDPYYPWTDPHFRRNLGEPIPADFLSYLPGRIRSYKLRHSFMHYLLGFLALPGFFALSIYFFGDYKIYHDAMEKQFYKPGVTYYTFELEDSDEVHQEHH